MKFVTKLAATMLLTQSVYSFAVENPQYSEQTAQAARLVVDRDREIVIDNDSGLMWRRCLFGSYGTRCEFGSSAIDLAYNLKKSLPQTQSILQDINSNGFGGYRDWRLPTLDEIQAIRNADPSDYRYNGEVSYGEWTFAIRGGGSVWTSTKSSDTTQYIFDYKSNITSTIYNGSSAYVIFVRRFK